MHISQLLMYTCASVHQLHQKSSETVENAFNSKSKINEEETAVRNMKRFNTTHQKLWNYVISELG